MAIDRDPSDCAVLAEADLIGLVRHGYDDQADTGPGVKPAVDESELGSTSTHEYSGQRSAEATASGV